MTWCCALPIPLEQIVIIGLAAWRLAYLLVFEGGPRDVVKRTRDWLRWPVLQCVYCTSVWIAILLYLVRDVAQIVIVIAAIAGVAAIVQRWLGFDFDAQK